MGQQNSAVGNINVDSLYRLIEKMTDKFNLDSSGYHGQLILDTIYYDSGNIKSVGSFAFDRNGNKSDYKVGWWKEYYENGHIKLFGEYQIDYLYVCSSAMPARAYYSYKFGYWTYYYENGKIMATGKYVLDKQKVFTGIADQYAKKPTVTGSWLLYNSSGQQTKDRLSFISLLNKME